MKKKQKYCFKIFHFIIHSLKYHALKHFKNINLVHELPFYDQLYIEKYQKHLKDMQENMELN